MATILLIILRGWWTLYC